MNSLLIDMIAAQATAQGNLGVAELLARLRSSGGDGGPTPDAVLSQLGQNDPMARVLAQHLAEARRQPVIDLEAIEETPVPPGQPIEESIEASAAILELRRHAESMFAELKVLRERNNLLAAAVGACCLCWGDDVECRICRGRGRPGFALPDEDLFEEFVLPAIRLLRARRSSA
jgi:hypothetical protein